MHGFPAAAIVEVPSRLAADLFDAAGRHPSAAPADYYDPARQSRARDEVRAGSPDDFDRLVAQIAVRLATPPFSALVRDLSYDESHRVFVAICRSLGELISPPPDHHPSRAQLLHFIRPAEDLKAASGQALTEKLHTDAADWPEEGFAAPTLSVAHASPKATVNLMEALRRASLKSAPRPRRRSGEREPARLAARQPRRGHVPRHRSWDQRAVRGT
jgi:hypothetical protein